MASAETLGVLGLDHATLVVPDLAAAIATYETLFAQGCTGRGSAEGLDWACFALANTALVLVTPGAQATHMAPVPAGLGALAFAVAEPERSARLLERRGLPGAGPALPWLAGPAVPLSPEAARGLHLALTAPRPAAAPSTTRLDHLVVRSADPERSLALFGGRLGLELRLDRSAPAWGTRFLFFRCGDTVLEVTHALADGVSDAPDALWGVTWGAADVAATHARLEAAGLPVSPLRSGRKPGTRIFTLRQNAGGVPTAFIGA